MKRIALSMICILLAVSVTNATDLHKNKWNCDDPISFTERGIEFFVFPNGDFDFNTYSKFCQSNYKASRRNGMVIQVNKSINYGVPIEHDAFGRIRRVGNVFINYDKRNRVNRIGNVFMKYNRFTLTHVGGMQIVYNHRGEMIDRIGNVTICDNYNYNDSNHNFDDHNNHPVKNHHDGYYYRRNQ